MCANTCGSSFGALAPGYLSNPFGRKPVLLASGFIYLIGSLIQAIVGLGTKNNVIACELLNMLSVQQCDLTRGIRYHWDQL